MTCCTCCSSRLPTVLLAVGLSLLVATAVGFGPKDSAAKGPGDKPVPKPDPAYVLGYEMNRIDGTAEQLDGYEGKVVLIVNVASKCGLTPQYEALEALYRSKKDDGLVILGFPANDFGKQEPGSNEEILAFCTELFEVSFPMFEKITVVGDDAHPLYLQLADQKLTERGNAEADLVGGEPRWNFTKFLVDRSGRVVARFSPRTTPDDEDFIAEIIELLGDEPGGG